MAKVAIVTGSNTGIGLDTATALCAKGFNVVMACRSEQKALQAIAQIRSSQADAQLAFLPLDTSSFASAKAFADEFVKMYSRLDVLILNAGTGYVKKELRTTEDGNEAFLQTNYLTHWLLTQALLPTLKATPGARVVCLTSVEHRETIRTDDWDRTNSGTARTSYAASKLAMALFAFELARRHPELTTAAVNPGAVGSDIWRYMDSWDGWYTAANKWVQRSLMLSVEQGCATSVHAATAPLSKGECVYISPYAEWPLLPYTSDLLCPFAGPTLRKAAEKVYDQAEQRRLWEWSLGKCEKWLPRVW